MRYMTVANVDTLDSREVAKMVDKRHDHLLRDIDGYVKDISENEELRSQNSTAPTLGTLDFFIESSYQDKKGETRKCYLITKMGCEFIGNKMQGKKGNLFTAMYVKRFNEMAQGKVAPPVIDTAKEMRAEAMLRNARVRQAKLLQELAQSAVTDTAKQILVIQAANITAGEKILALPKADERATTTATELCHRYHLKKTWATALGRKLNERLERNSDTGYNTQTVSEVTHKEVKQWNWYVDKVIPVMDDMQSNGIFDGHYEG